MYCGLEMDRALSRVLSAAMSSRLCSGLHQFPSGWHSAAKTSSQVYRPSLLCRMPCLVLHFADISCAYMQKSSRMRPDGIIFCHAELVNAASGADRLFQTPIPVKCLSDTATCCLLT